MSPALAAHAPVLAALHADAFPPGERWGADAIALQVAQPGAFGWWGSGGFVVARVAADEAEILTLAVAASHRRRGEGRALMQAAMREAAARGAGAMYLEVAETNVPARGLYDALGFAVVGRRPHYYPGGGAALVLRRALPFSGGAAAAA